jgi:hypothetical protein
VRKRKRKSRKEAKMKTYRYEWNDDVTDLIPESMLREALENPHLSKEDKAKIRARLKGEK